MWGVLRRRVPLPEISERRLRRSPAIITNMTIITIITINAIITITTITTITACCYH